MDNRFIINIGRQLGSGGVTIGEIIARRLGVPLYDKELITLAARKSGLCPELFERADERESRSGLAWLIGYLRAPFSGDDGCSSDPLSNDSLFRIQSDVIRDIAARESCIFVGRCADYILRDDPRAVNIFLSASEEARVHRLCDRTGCTEALARTMMERGDQQRAEYYNYYSSRRWGVASTYHLCLDTSVLDDEATADLIIDFVRRKLHLKLGK